MPSAKTPRKQPAVKKLGPDDAVLQKRKTTPRNVDVDQANQVPDPNWEIGTAEDPLEAARARQPAAKKPG